MAYAKHIGRVGALAVTLGVGMAIANTPGIAYAGPDPSSPSGGTTSTSESSTENESSNESSTENKISPNEDAASAEAGDDDSSVTHRRAHRRSVLRSVAQSIRQSARDAVADIGNQAGARRATDEDLTPGSSSDDPADRKASDTVKSESIRKRLSSSTLAETADQVESAVTAVTERVASPFRAPSTSVSPEAPQTSSFAPATNDPVKSTVTMFSSTFAPATLAVPEPRTSLVSIVTDLLGAVLQPVLYPGNESPLQAPMLVAILAAARDEIVRFLVRRPTTVAYPQPNSQPVYPDPPADPTEQHVLVIAIDGTNMSKVLADEDNDNFFALMDTSTNSAPSIVGHTTVSNPSWTAILTGAWNEKTGVINNIYTPTTYDRWPTVFTQLETYDPDIETKAIADWDVIGAIAASGEVGADEVVYISRIPGDANWSQTDAAVTAEAVKTIEGTEAGYEEVPNFLVAYLVQVDENGHLYGADSPEYAEAIARTDENLGDILAAVAAREQATCDAGACEDWTVIVVTDHGHQPQPGFGHGFQSPDETTTFVIADGPQFGDSAFNPDYEIVDVTPTVLYLFGAPQPKRTDGVPLTSLRGSDSVTGLTQDQLQDLLKAQMALNDYPNLIVNVALSVRTIVGFVPYFVYGVDLPTPIHEILYVGTNVPAQIVAFFTGVYGARLFPILPPPPPTTFIPQEATAIESALIADCGNDSLTMVTCIAS